jgi:hypothetical protein
MAVLNPKNAPWNAKGDGKADDQKALQACFNAAKAGGHSVLIPAGTYNHSSVLTIDSIKVSGVNGKPGDGPVTMLYATDRRARSIELKGVGPELTKMRVHSWPQTRQIDGGAPPEKSGVRVRYGTRNFRITHIWIEGDNKKNSLKNIGGIFVQGSTNGYIARNTIMYTVADSIHTTTSRSTYPSRNTIVEYNYIWQSGDDCTAFVGYGYNFIQDCVSRYNYVGGNRGGRGITGIGTKGLTVLGNFVEGGGNERAGILVASEPNWWSAGNQDTLVKNNTVYRAGGSGQLTQVLKEEHDKTTRHAAILIVGNTGTHANQLSKSIQVIDNQVFESKRWGLETLGGSAVRGVTAKRNKFYHCAAGAVSWSKPPVGLVAPTSGPDANSGNLPVSDYPGNKALGGAANRTIAAQRVGCNTTWTADGVQSEADPLVYLPDSVTVTEGDSTTITVTKSGTGACSVTVATSPGTATPGDFTAIPPTVLKFAKDQETQTVTLQTTADSLVEKNETVRLVLSSPTNCTLSNETCVVTIVDSTVKVPDNPVSLPWPARTAFDWTVHLDKDSRRTFAGDDVVGKHIRVIPKASVDTDAGLFFDGAASVTVIGGAFKPSAVASSGDASLYFRDCGAVYLEGVLVDNASISQGHAVLVHAGSAKTDITLQNCRLVNVTGSDKGIRGTIFSTGTAGTGRAGSVRIHNLTGSVGIGTRGFYVPAEINGGMTGLLLRNINVVRTDPGSAFAFYHFLNKAADFEANGYPIDLDNVWGSVSSTQKIEAHGVWPNSRAGTNPDFGPVFAAVRAPDPFNSDQPTAGWPLLNDPARDWEGFVCEGSPPDGDFVPAAKVGLTYVPGIDLVETGPVSSDPPTSS